MIVTCAECSTSYHTSVEDIGKHGRKVQCTNCKNIWFQREIKAEKLNKLPKYTTISSSSNNVGSTDYGNMQNDDLDKRFLPVVIPQSNRSLLSYFASAFIVLVAIIVPSILFRKEITREIPYTIPLYDAVGIASPSKIKLSDVEIDVKQEGYLDVNGFIVNEAKFARITPHLIIIMPDANNKIITKIVKMPNATILVNGKLPFYQRFYIRTNNMDKISIQAIDYIDFIKHKYI